MDSSKKWTELLLRCGVVSPLGKMEFHTKCPFHDDKHDSLSINIQKGVWICHAGCGQGSLRSFIGQFFDSLYFDYQFDDDLFGDLIEPAVDDFIYKEVQLPSMFKVNDYPQWIFSRGFSKQTLEDWRCCRNPTTNSLIIPAFTKSNNLVGWIARRPPGQEPRYLYPNFFKKSSILFGQNMNIRQLRLLFIVEGPLDALWMYQNGYFACALLGVHLSLRQFQLLQMMGGQLDEIVLCLDNDAAGQKMTDKIIRELQRVSVVSKIVIPQGFKDVQDIRNSSLLMSIIENRSEFDL